ncbi:unnamed protein product [Paramecium sonneborni]|uniref:Mitochondrial pyruvate carrier n=1 Tax=Paramecium sonneborni TaxID=65129 RepID=A0A8S1R963_9CILI|nr:unnamed protein product [Paramecium sonneborni]CAD8124388.1 unnamed protein product [Paramecium sonneborni]
MASKVSGMFWTWVHSSTGPKTTHFWAPVCNWFFPIQALYDWNRDPAKISKEMQCVLVCYSSLFMRWALRISPQSYILFCMHLFNATLQGRLLLRRLMWESSQQKAIEDKPTN